MAKLTSKLRNLGNTAGQDLLEFALIAGMVALGSGAIMPGASSSISAVFSRAGSVLKLSSTQGS